MSVLQLCLLSSEILPYAKTGGLADVTGALLRNLSATGHHVRAFMPLYPKVRRHHGELWVVPGVEEVSVSVGSDRYVFGLLATNFPGSDIPVYFVDCPALFGRDALYTFDADEHRRFIVFTRAVLESCRQLKFAPDILHCHDWHTALLPLYLKTLYAAEPVFARSKSIMTIHNIGYQGVFPSSALTDLGLGNAWLQLDHDDIAHGVINPLRTGIKFADRVTTVSPTYAREICDAPLGMGMQHVLRGRKDAVVGILNGVDYDAWDPRHDPHLSTHFTPQDLSGKRANKERLLKMAEMRLPPARPLVGIVSRLAEQKGFDLLFDALPDVLRARDFGLVVLGSGEPRYMNFFDDLSRRFAGRVWFYSGYDENLAHLIEAGSDIFLMPSRYEPCGLNQMYSMRYGTIPVVRKTGGLADSVAHFNPERGTGTGCVFNDYDAPAVRWALNTVLDWFENVTAWAQLVQNAMAQDFSWRRQIKAYETLYRETLSG